MKVVVCGSFGDLDGFLQFLHLFRVKYGTVNVFPDEEHMEKSKPCIFAHHVIDNETENTIVMRSKLMETYFKNIDNADIVIVVNQKNGQEYYGTGTTIELGYAIARRKKILFVRQPTNPNILSLIKIMINANDTSDICIS